MKAETATLSLAAAPAAGPLVVQLLGYDIPVVSAAFGMIGVVLALALAPPPKRRLGRGQTWALRILLVLLTLTLVVYDQKSPLVSLGWAIGLGFSGYTVIELLGAMVPDKLRGIFGTAPNTNDSPEEHK